MGYRPVSRRREASVQGTDPESGAFLALPHGLAHGAD